MRYSCVICGIVAGFALLLSGGEMKLHLPSDLDYAKGLFFINGKGFPVAKDRNRVWIKRGAEGSFTGNTIDVFYRGGGKKFTLLLDGKKLPGRTGGKWFSYTRLTVPYGKHTIVVPDQKEIITVCCKDIYDRTGSVICRPVKLPRNASNIRAAVQGGSAEVILKNGRAIVQAKTSGNVLSELKLLWDGTGSAAVEERPAAPSALRCTLLDNMVKILPDKVYTQQKGVFELYGTPGEKVSFQIALRSALPDEFVSVAGRIPCGKIESAFQYSFLVSYARRDRFTNNRLGPLPIRIPDMLQPSSSGFIRKDQTAAFHLTLHIDKNAKARKYQGEIVVQTVQGRKVVPFRVNVLPFKLPSPEEYKFEIQHSAYFIRRLAKDCGIREGSPEFFRLFDETLEMLKANGQNMIEFSWEYLPVQAVFTKDGKWQFDFSTFDKYYGRILNFFKDYPRFRMVIPYAYWGTRNPDESMHFNNGKVRFRVWKDKERYILSPEYKAFFKAFLPAFYNHLDRYGAREKVWFRIFDEPKKSHIRRYRVIRDYLKSVASEFKVQDSVETGAVYEHLNNRIDLAIAHLYSVTPLEKILKKRSGSGLATGVYSAMTGPAGSWLNMNFSGLRVQPYVAYQLGAVMINNYGWYYTGGIDYREYPSGANSENPGDSAKVYAIPEAKTFLPSIRALVVRDARYDFALLQKLEELNRNAMKKLGIKDSDPSADGKTLCRLLGELPAIFNVSGKNILEIRKRLCSLILERSGTVPVVIDGELNENSNIGTLRIRTVPGARVTVNGQTVANGIAQVLLSPEKNSVAVTVNGKKFTKYFHVKSNRLDALKKLIHVLEQITKVPDSLAKYPAAVEKSSALDFGKLLKEFPEVQKRLQTLYIEQHLEKFFRNVVPAEIKASVALVRQLHSRGKNHEAIRLIDMLMRLDPARLRKAPSGTLIYPHYQDNRFYWCIKNRNVAARFQADTMRLVSLKRQGKEFCAQGMTELFDSDLMGRDAENWELFPGEDTPEKVVLRGRRFCDNITIARQVILTQKSDMLHFRTQIRAGNLPTWEMRWRTHAFYRGTHFGDKEISSCPVSQRFTATAPYCLRNQKEKTLLYFIPRKGIRTFMVWHGKENMNTIDFAVQEKFTHAFGKVYCIAYDLYPAEEGVSCPEKSVVPGQKEILIDFTKKLSRPHKIHGKVRFSSEGLVLEGNGAVELLPSADFSFRYPFTMTFDFTPAAKGGVLFKRSRSQGEFYFYPQRRHVLILPSVRTSIPRYIRHIIPDSCKGRQLFTVSHDGDRLHLFLNGRRIKEPSLYPGTAGNGLPDGLFIGAYGVHGRKVQQFFHGTIHSVKITYGSAAEGENF